MVSDPDELEIQSLSNVEQREYHSNPLERYCVIPTCLW